MKDTTKFAANAGAKREAERQKGGIK